MNTNQTISNSKNNNNNMQASDAIEARMQTVQASLRQERDKARRDYELAMERLGLLRAEVEATDIAVQDRQKQLTTIVEETQRLEAKLPSLRETVQRLTKEFDFQHAEIITKREKQKQLERSVEKAANKRQKLLRQITAMVKKRRMMLQASAKGSPFEEKELPSSHAFQDELEDAVVRERFSNEFIILVQKKERMYKDETDHMRQQIQPKLQRVLERYSKGFGFTLSATGPDAAGSIPEESPMEYAIETQKPDAKPALEGVSLPVDTKMK